ncbi:MAG: leucine--tRNA ligase [bacterium]|nr:leucine--tRNA ligase [bacterium]
MREYNHKEIEKKWQDEWSASNIYKTEDVSGKPKCFVLDMFPYPSGEGLHVGHPKGYIATDIYSRYKRMNGFNVLHPMGWDAFGLPAENYALKNKVHPRIAVEENIVRFKEQLSIIGFDLDWSREINTTDPAYYKWTQWIFLKLYEKGLAYESNEPINWCPSCLTGLANEDVEDGACERCGTPVEKKPIRQWVLKITDYAERLLDDVALLSWDQHIIDLQRNWIGKKDGIVITHKIDGVDETLDTFTAYVAWSFADTYVVMAPEHPLARVLAKGTSQEEAVDSFIKKMESQSAIDRTGAKEKEGVFTGRFAIDPLRRGERLPIWIANFALMGFGTGAMRCSSHDERDVEFAQKYDIPLRAVVADEQVSAHDNTGTLLDSAQFTGREISTVLIQEMMDWMEAEGFAKRQINYRLQDWVFSRQRYWGEPIPIIHCQKCGVVPVPEDQLPVILPEVESYEPTGTGESPLAAIEEWVNVSCPTCGGPAKRETNTMPQWAGSSWYYLRYIDTQNSEALVDPEKEKHWMPVDMYVGGAEHATRHLIYARFWHKFLNDIGAVSTTEPFVNLRSQGLILGEDGRKMSKRWGNVINPTDIVDRFGADSFRVYEMFMGPFEGSIAWSTDGVVGSRRFIERVWRSAEYIGEGAVSADLDRLLHKTIKKVSADIERFSFNTAVSSMMMFSRAVEETGFITAEQYRAFLSLLAPLAPHVCEELWQIAGGIGSVHTASWPEFSDEIAQDSHVTIVVQINGKVRAEFTVSAESQEEEVVGFALADERVQKWLGGQKPKKTIYIKGRMVSLVT